MDLFRFLCINFDVHQFHIANIVPRIVIGQPAEYVRADVFPENPLRYGVDFADDWTIRIFDLLKIFGSSDEPDEHKMCKVHGVFDQEHFFNTYYPPLLDEIAMHCLFPHIEEIFKHL